ncbi:hypothetical protein MKW94_013567 [Papaver nudicaule]|uniref:histone acetyltransferase n=1 Tax=Papaver nudicaule TaxID=74823 RepID=A0AA41VD47_PAPNU|nr:hypothetical protein [Papaver nudicaule]
MMLVDTHHRRSMAAPFSSTGNWCGNWCVLPPLKAPLPHVRRREITRKNWRQESGMSFIRNMMRSYIERILVCPTRNSNQCDQLKLRKVCDYVENLLFIQALTKAEYKDFSTLRSRVKTAARSILSPAKFSDLPVIQHQQLEQRSTMHSNFVKTQASAQHYVNKPTVPCTSADAGSSEPRKTTKRTAGPTRDFSPALEFPIKRRKTDHTSTPPGMSYESSVTTNNKQELKLSNIIHKSKTKEKKLSHPKIIQPNIHTEIPISQSAITDDDRTLGSVSSKRRGDSLTKMFTRDQLGGHLTSLRKWSGKTKQKADEKREMGEIMNDNACQLCGLGKLFFEVGCFRCGILFKKRDKYHSASNLGVECRCCNKCFDIIGGEKNSVSGVQINKEKISLDTDISYQISYQEPFVLCDRCGVKQHHTCALFNKERNLLEGKAGYVCPKCDTNELEDGHGPLPQNVDLGAADLRRTKLSDFLEDRLCSSLKQERDERAKAMGKNSDEVPGAENLVVRVVLSVEKSLQVKPEIHDVLNYPEKLPYRSKVILLFQKIDGVEVCLFGMYVQEYGSKCAPPNQRSIYISYLDSVKYFQPDIRTATGERLRTFVYQEILVGYLDYCKRRGFSKCYLWSCPPSKADRSIFYCHPGIQKNPSSEILRVWYRKMLNKAKAEGIAADVTNYYDYFFKRDRKHKAELKKLIDEIVPSVRRTRKQRPSSEAVRCTDDSGSPPLGDKLMEKLGEKMKKQKQNFIIVDLGTQHMAADTDQEEDEVIEGSLFSIRDNFLNLSKKKHYQFDNLQRAKHSTKMILHHLRNPDIAQEEV